MKFIYVLKEDVSKDLESAGLQKIGTSMINGIKVDIFENSREIYINKYQKSEVFLSNRLHFDYSEL